MTLQPIKLITQNHTTGCGVACFAMVLGISYNRAMKLLHPTRFWWFSKATTTVGQMHAKLEALGRKSTLSEESDFMALNKRTIVIVKTFYKGKNNHHAVVWDPVGECILDPARGNPLSVEYCIDKFVVAIIVD